MKNKNLRNSGTRGWPRPPGPNMAPPFLGLAARYIFGHQVASYMVILVNFIIHDSVVKCLFADLAVYPIFQSSNSSEKPREVILGITIATTSQIFFLDKHEYKLVCNAGRQWVDYITFHIQTAICFWVVRREVEPLCSLELDLLLYNRTQSIAYTRNKRPNCSEQNPPTLQPKIL